MYGSFSDKDREFVISNPATPRPWINYLTTKTGSYVSLLSANAGGYSYIKCPKDGRLTRWRYNGLPEDRPGKYIYLRKTDEAGAADFWTISWQPTAKDLDHYKVRHGLGYTVFESTYAGINAEATYFVPLDDTCELWKVTLKNTTDQPVSLEVYPFAEMCMGHALIDLINKPNDQHFNRLWFDKDNKSLFVTKTYWVTGSSANIQENKSWDQVGFMTSSLPIEGYAGEREVFVGSYRDESAPRAIEEGSLQNKDISSGNLVGCLQSKIEIAPGEECSFHVTLGAAQKGAEDALAENCYALINKYSSVEAVDEALSAVKSYWEGYCSSVQVNTPSETMNRYINQWNQYQGKVTFINSRNASYYHWGVHRGMGFRDSLQDTISTVIPEPALVRDRLILLSSYQRKDGVCAHCFHPISCEAEFTGHKDDPLWLITAMWYYLAETDDASILTQSSPFFDGEEATMLDHLKASVAFIEENLGASGIPTFGRGDWNDTLDYVGGADGMGESIWAGMFYAFNLKRLEEILEKYVGDTTYLSYIQERYAKVKEALNSFAWDGEWYIRAVCSDGKKLGSAECEEGKIYLNPQSWAVLSGVADEKGTALMKTTMEKLDTECGPKLLAPAYHNIDQGIGLITRCVWGKKENGAIFNHTVTWVLMALCEIGETEAAMDLYHRVAPSNFDQDRYQIEPYAYAQYTTSDEHETFGQGSHSWLTGTAAWMFRATVDYILGIKVTLDGLVIAPAIPESWDGFSAVRNYRGTEYAIEVKSSGENFVVVVNGVEYTVKRGESVAVGSK